MKEEGQGKFLSVHNKIKLKESESGEKLTFLVIVLVCVLGNNWELDRSLKDKGE